MKITSELLNCPENGSQMIIKICKTFNFTKNELADFIGCKRSTFGHWSNAKNPIPGPSLILIRLLYEASIEVSALSKCMYKYLWDENFDLTSAYNLEHCLVFGFDYRFYAIKLKGGMRHKRFNF